MRDRCQEVTSICCFFFYSYYAPMHTNISRLLPVANIFVIIGGVSR